MNFPVFRSIATQTPLQVQASISPATDGKVGCFGTCSGGRHTVIAAGRIDRFDAAIDCWGGRVVMAKSARELANAILAALEHAEANGWLSEDEEHSAAHGTVAHAQTHRQAPGPNYDLTQFPEPPYTAAHFGGKPSTLWISRRSADAGKF